MHMQTYTKFITCILHVIFISYYMCILPNKSEKFLKKIKLQKNEIYNSNIC